VASRSVVLNAAISRYQDRSGLRLSAKFAVVGLIVVCLAMIF
jgi:hypothetical protein